MSVSIARTHCANCRQRDGTCYLTGEGCHITSERCSYFEESVMPMEKWDWRNKLEGRALQEACLAYRQRFMKPQPRKAK